MTYTEKELDQFLHGISLSLLSKKSAQHWRYDEETAKEIEWLEVLERKVRADKADRKTEPTHDLRTETHECVKDTHDKTSPNSSEKPNNCEHITEDGVTCAKYPACDDCPDNPLNKVKGSERLVKGSEQTDCDDTSCPYFKNPDYSRCMRRKSQTDCPTEWCEHCELWRENNCIGVAQCKQNIKALKELSDLYEADTPQTETSTNSEKLQLAVESQTDVYDYKGNGKWERSK